MALGVDDISQKSYRLQLNGYFKTSDMFKRDILSVYSFFKNSRLIWEKVK